jgi:hypothetical protein
LMIPEVRKATTAWKERSYVSSLVILAFIITLSLFAEINSGIILSTIVDPIMGPASILVLTAIMIPLHIFFSKMHAKLIMTQLDKRQKELHLQENLANLFEKNLTVPRMLLPLSEPAGWNKKTKARLTQLSDKTKEIVQLLNDSFGSYDDNKDFHSDTQSLKELP